MSIFDEVLAFIRHPVAEGFEPLALAVFRYQCAHVAPYQHFIASHGIKPAHVTRLDAIPPLSTRAFKYAALEASDAAPPHELRVFFTSGTTQGPHDRGRHGVVRPDVYRASAIAHLRRMLFPDAMRPAMLALHPTAGLMPHSSLSQMITWCIEEFGGDEKLCAATPQQVDIAAAISFLREQERRDRPVCILATTAACAALFSALAASAIRLKLPRGSRLMDTGGAKGQTIPLTPAEVVAHAEHQLGIPPSMTINEYGMTEMCSQFYDATAFNSTRAEPPGHRWKLPPPWLRAFALDPLDLHPLAAGEPGLLAFFDLANVGSVSMLLTEDIGIVNEDAVRLLGRSATAEPRGCALAIAEFNPSSQASSD